MSESKIICPNCRKDNVKVLGTKGATGRQIVASLVGPLGQLLFSKETNQGKKTNFCPKCKTEYQNGFTTCSDCGEPLVNGEIESTEKLQYKCNNCRNSFIIEESHIGDYEKLKSACKIIFHRDKGFVGALMDVFVYLNGKEIASVKNGKSIEFSTNVKSNTINVTDHTGLAFKDSYNFDAIEDGVVEVHFNRKFV